MFNISKILLIEDDRFISELYSRSLRKAGYEVEEVITGPEGIARAKSGEFQIVLLDIMIPDVTGVDVLKDLKGEAGELLANTKIIITTNLDLDEETRQKLEERADGYLIKADVTPRKLIEILKKVEQFGEMPHQSEPQTL